MSDKIFIRNPKYREEPVVVVCERCKTALDQNNYCSVCNTTQES